MKSFFTISPLGPAALSVLTVVIGVALGAAFAVTPLS
jgi:hypothetical protein